MLKNILLSKTVKYLMFSLLLLVVIVSFLKGFYVYGFVTIGMAISYFLAEYRQEKLLESNKKTFKMIMELLYKDVDITPIRKVILEELIKSGDVKFYFSTDPNEIFKEK